MVRSSDADSTAKLIWRSTFREALVVVIFSALLAFGTNAIRTDGLSILTPSKHSSIPGEEEIHPHQISLDRAKTLFLIQQARFVDARPKADFDAGHIPSAISLPLTDIDSGMQEFITQIDPQVTVITYCSGDTCLLSEELANIIRSWGYGDVWYMSESLSDWQRNGLPIESSEIQ
jgi:rhodanese-related sulfurtransferase